MTLLVKAYKTCKEIRKSASRNQARDVLMGVITVNEADKDTENDRTQLGYVARELNTQILGFLLADQHRDKFDLGDYPFPVPPLTDQERILLDSVHNRFVLLNEKCIEPILSILPQCIPAILPYRKYNFTPQPDIPVSDILSSEIIDEIAQSFHRCPAVDTVLESAKNKITIETEEQYIDHFSKIFDVISKTETSSAPEFVRNITLTHKRNSPERTFIRHMLALLCINDMLKNLNQLLYQSILHDKLHILDEDNIISVKRQVSHAAGDAISLTFQTDERLFLLRPGYLVLVKVAHPRLTIDHLYFYEKEHLQFSPDSGERIHGELREIDENLTRFGKFLRDV